VETSAWGNKQAALTGTGSVTTLATMTPNDAVRELATAGNKLPRPAMQWALDHWDEAGPGFVALLDSYASGADHSEQTEQALFFIVHLLGEKAEATAFTPLCRLLRDREASDLIFGDAITTTLRCILVSTYDGDPTALQAVIEAEAADDFVREAALLALAYLTRTGRVPEAAMRTYLLRLLDEMQPQAENFVWVGWLLAVADLGYSDLSEQAEEVVRRGFVDSVYSGIKDFQEDLKRTLDDPTGMAGFEHERVAPFTDAIGELEKWFAFSGRDAPVFPDPRTTRFSNPSPTPCAESAATTSAPAAAARSSRSAALPHRKRG